MINRRDAIKRIGGLAGAATLSKFLGGCHDDGSPKGITTYVYLMLENRSYDHVFGARSMLEGLPGDGLKMTMSNPDQMGTAVHPYEPVDTDLCDPDPPHDWVPLHASWNNGACDGFVKQYQLAKQSTTLKNVMQYLTRRQMPVSWALADAYTSCDRWFCSIMGPTLPNRAYWHVGTSLGIGKDSNANSEILNSFSGGLPVPSIYNSLHDKGIDWAYYYGSIPVVSLLSQDGPYYLDLGPNDGTGNVRRYGQFMKDAAAGTLPPVVYIDPYFYMNDDHPPIHPINGQALIAATYTALANSPQWKNCLLVVTYDENGGFFDHVSPPKAPADDTLQKFQQDGFDQMGFRVPTMVIGPYVKQGVNSTVYDHTSALKHLQNAFGLDPLTARSDAATDLTDCIDMDRLAKGQWSKPIELPMINEADWPMDPNMCSYSGGFRYVEQDPISLWANDNPAKVAGLDLRHERSQYDATIRSFLREHGVLK